MVRPVTVMEQAVAPLHEPVTEPGDEVAVYLVIAEPPSDNGAVKLIVA